MRIISKDSDYYDGYMNHDKDDYTNKVWVRGKKEVKINKDDLIPFESLHFHINHNRQEHCYLIVAGKVYPMIIRHNTDGSRDYYYDEASYRAENPIKQRRYNFYTWLFREDELELFFKNRPDMTELCLKFESPIILISPCSYSYKEKYSSFRTCEINVNLKDIGFSKIMEAPIVYQELDYFISNVMVKDEMPSIPMTDADKIQAHGFDKKTSFRKTKEEK